MAKKKENNHQIIKNLKVYKKNLLAMTSISDITILISDVIGYLDDYPLLKKEFKRKYDNYVKMSYRETFRNFQEKISDSVLEKLPDDMFRQTQHLQKYNIPKFFYYPAFKEMRYIIETDSGVLNFYKKNYKGAIDEYLKIKKPTKGIIQALEDFNFYITKLPDLDKTFTKKGQPEEFNLKYLSSAIIGVIEYFENYIPNFESVANYKEDSVLPHYKLPPVLYKIYNLIDEDSTYKSIAVKLNDHSKNYVTTRNNIERLAVALGFESDPLKSVKRYKRLHAN